MKISVVIPASKDAKIEALESLNSQEKKVFEIIVERGTNTSRNRNNGIKKSRGDLVAFVNAHTILRKDWTRKIEEFFRENKNIDIVGGPQLTPVQNSLFGKSSGVALTSIFGAANLRNRYSIGKLKIPAEEEDLTSANLICKRKVFEKVLFDESIYPGEDPKFISDSKKNNMQIAYSPEIVSYNKRRDSLNGLIKQMFNYGRMRPKKEKIIETIKHPLFLIPSFFVLYLIFFGLFCLFNKNSLLLIISSVPFVTYLFLDLIFSILGFIRIKKVFGLFYLMIIYPAIHISYGLGLLRGFLIK
jgi:hypothetical protein